jgi:hypothetical protein
MLDKSAARKAAESRNPMTRDVLEPQLNIPETIRLQYRTGKQCEGRNGPRVMFSLVDERVLFLDLHVADRIYALGVSAGEPFTICKMKSGNSFAWQVARLEEAPVGNQSDGTFIAPRVAAGAGVAAPAPTVRAASQTPSNDTRNFTKPGTPRLKVPMDQAILEAVLIVKRAMQASGEQWSDASRQGLVSTIIIGAQKEGWVTMWNPIETEETRRNAA